MKKWVAPLTGIFLVILSLILVLTFRNTNKSIISLIVLISTILGGIFVIRAIKTTEETWLKWVLKLIFILPYLIFFFSVLLWNLFNETPGMGNSYNLSVASTWAFQNILPFLVIILLFFTLDKIKNIFLNVLTWIVGIIAYFIMGVIGAAFVSPPHS